MAPDICIVRPKPSSWLTLAVATAPIWGFAAYCAATGLPWEALVSLVFAGTVIGYNYTLRLRVIELRRFGRCVWLVSRSAATLRRGLVGDVKLQSGYIVEDHGQAAGYLLDGWFSKDAFELLLRATNPK